MASWGEALSPSHETATEGEEIVEEDLVSGGAAGNDDHEEEEDYSNDPFPVHSLPAGRPLHSTQLIDAAKEGNMLVRKYERGKMVGHELVDPSDYDPYKRSYLSQKEEEKWRPFRALPPHQDPDPPALCIGRPGCYSIILGCAAFVCMSVFAFFLIVVLFYLEDFGDIKVWMYGDPDQASPPPPPPPPPSPAVG